MALLLVPDFNEVVSTSRINVRYRDSESKEEVVVHTLRCSRAEMISHAGKLDIDTTVGTFDHRQEVGGRSCYHHSWVALAVVASNNTEGSRDQLMEIPTLLYGDSALALR